MFPPFHFLFLPNGRKGMAIVQFSDTAKGALRGRYQSRAAAGVRRRYWRREIEILLSVISLNKNLAKYGGYTMWQNMLVRVRVSVRLELGFEIGPQYHWIVHPCNI